MSGVAGTYVLQTINGQPLPAPVSGDLYRTIEFVSATLTLNENGTYTGRSVVRIIEGEVVTTDPEEVTGRYTRSGSTLTLVGGPRNDKSRIEIVNSLTLRGLDSFGSVFIYEATR